jgi:hypothetical protein
MVLRMMFWAEPMRGGKVEKFKEDLIAAGHTSIKAFTLMEVELTCKVREFTRVTKCVHLYPSKIPLLVELYSVQTVQLCYLVDV